jgi:hypothetical protein
MGKNSFYAGRVNSRVLRYANVNNVPNAVVNRPSNVVVAKIISTHNRILFIIDAFFEPRCSIMIKYLIDIGYILDTIDIKIVSPIDNIETILLDHYKRGYRLFFGTQNSSTLIGLLSFFTTYPDAMYLNSGSTIYVPNLDEQIPSNIVRTSCNINDCVKFIMNKLVFNFHQYFDLIDNAKFNNLFDHVDDSLKDGQVFNQVVYICDSLEFTGKIYNDTFADFITAHYSSKVSFISFALDIANDNYTFDKELDILLTENPVNRSQYQASKTKSIFIIKCTNDLNLQPMLNYFSKSEYYNNIIIFNEKFNTCPNNIPYHSVYDFKYGFILSGGFSELGYKICNKLFGDYNIGGETLSLVDILTFVPNIFKRVIDSGNVDPVTRLIEHLNNTRSVDRNDWHVKSLYLYELQNKYDTNNNWYNFNSQIIMYQKIFNPDTVGSSSSTNWIDEAISGYPTAPGNTTYSANLSSYNLITGTNTNLNEQILTFTNTQDISDYKTKLDSFFKGSPSPNSTSAIFGFWKLFTNTNILSALEMSIDDITVYIPYDALDPDSIVNDNYYIHFNKTISYNYKSYVNGIASSVETPTTVTINIPITFSDDNYLLYFNKGHEYTYTVSGKTYTKVRGALRIYFKMLPKVINKYYRLNDVIDVSSTEIGPNISAIVDSISPDNYTLSVTNYENEASNGITSNAISTANRTVLKLNSASDIANLYVKTDISQNVWSSNGCYYLALLPNGQLVANDYRTNFTFWNYKTSSLNTSNLSFSIIDSTLSVVLLDTDQFIYATVVDLIIDNSLLIYPITLTITDDRNVAIINANIVPDILWSSNTMVTLSFTSTTSLFNNSPKLYSLNGYYSLSFSNGNLLFNDEKQAFGDGLIWQLYDGYLNDNLTTLAGLPLSTIVTPNTGVCTDLGSIKGITGSGVTITKYSLVISGFFKSTVAGSYKFALSCIGSGYLWIGDTALPQNRILTSSTSNAFLVNRSNGGSTSVEKSNYFTVVANTFYPFCIIFGESTQYDTFSCQITLPNGNKITNWSGYSFNPTNLAVTSTSGKQYFWDSIKPIYSTNCSGLSWTAYNGFFDNNLSFFNNNTNLLTGNRGASSGFINDMSVGLDTSTNDNITQSQYVVSTVSRSFSIMWIGYIMSTYNITLQFAVNANSPYYLWIGPNAINYTTSNSLLYNSSTTTNPNIKYVNFSVIANTYYPIRIIYGQNSGYNPFALAVTNASINSMYKIYNSLSYAQFTDDGTLTLKNELGTYYNVLKNAGISSSSVTPVKPYSLKINNNRNISMYDYNNKLQWNLNTPFRMNVIQDNCTISNLYPRIGDVAHVHTALDPRYSGTDSYIMSVDADRTSTVEFFEDDSAFSNTIYTKPSIRTSLHTDSNDNYDQDNIYLSNFELTYLTSNIDNVYFYAKLESTGVISIYDNRIYDNKMPYKIWSSNNLNIPSGETVTNCNLDINGSLIINTLTTGAVVNTYYIFQNLNIDNLYSSPYSLVMQNDGNLVIYSSDSNNTAIWSSDTFSTPEWYSSNSSFLIYDSSYGNFPRIVSDNGIYGLVLTNGAINIRNNYTKSIIYTFKYSGKPLFYSGLNSVTNSNGTSTNGNMSANQPLITVPGHQVYTCGSIRTNTGWISSPYNSINTNINITDSNDNPLDKICYVWITNDANTNSNTAKGTYDFSTVYNNTTGYTIDATLYVTADDTCDIYQNNILFSSKVTSYGQLISLNVVLQPGNNSFKFHVYNGGGKAGLVFYCYPKVNSSCSLYIDSTGKLMTSDVTVNYAQVSGISGINYNIMNSTAVANSIYRMLLNNDGSLAFYDSNGTRYFTTTASTSYATTTYVPTDRNGILMNSINMFTPANDKDLTQNLWSPNGIFYLSISLDKTIAIYDVRFNKPVYTFSTSTSTSTNASYLTLLTTGDLVAYDTANQQFWHSNTVNSSYKNYRIVLDDTGMLSIIGDNSSGVSVTTRTYNDLKNLDNFIISTSTTPRKYYPGHRILTSRNGNYILYFDSSGNLDIKYIDDHDKDADPNNDDDSKDISVYTQYHRVYSATSTVPESMIFGADGVIRMFSTAGLSMWSSNASYLGIPDYTLVLHNTGNLAIYDGTRVLPNANDIGSVTACTRWSNIYNALKSNTYAVNNYRWLWNDPDAYTSAEEGTVYFQISYKNTRTYSISAKLYCGVDDTCDIYMNKTKINTDTIGYNTLKNFSITIPPGTSLFEFVAKNSLKDDDDTPAGIIFYCIDTGNSDINTNTLFFSNPNTVYVPESLSLIDTNFGFKVWETKTAYSETILYSNYSIDNTTIPENQIKSNEYLFMIPLQFIISPNTLYKLRFEQDGTLKAYLITEDGDIQYWSSGTHYQAPANPTAFLQIAPDAARLQFGPAGFGLYDSVDVSYHIYKVPVVNVIYTFSIDDDSKIRLRGSDGYVMVFNE